MAFVLIARRARRSAAGPHRRRADRQRAQQAAQRRHHLRCARRTRTAGVLSHARHRQGRALPPRQSHRRPLLRLVQPSGARLARSDRRAARNRRVGGRPCSSGLRDPLRCHAATRRLSGTPASRENRCSDRDSHRRGDGPAIGRRVGRGELERHCRRSQDAARHDDGTHGNRARRLRRRVSAVRCADRQRIGASSARRRTRRQCAFYRCLG